MSNLQSPAMVSGDRACIDASAHDADDHFIRRAPTPVFARQAAAAKLERTAFEKIADRAAVPTADSASNDSKPLALELDFAQAHAV